uniref:sphingosine 1-phosphate receptor 2-like isoform X3 n=1 Tax=Styela clava TaxID=7725 RepID=UPI0019393351|nr:sphingosine 1-phosphate receptor 2-like isoform X3 [Styela clava]
MSYGEPHVEPKAEIYLGPYPESEPEPEVEPGIYGYGNVTGEIPIGDGEPDAATISDPTIMRIMASVAGIISIGIIIQNVLVLFVLWRAWPKQNPTITYFIIHLACADLASGFQFLWFNCIDIFLRKTHEGMWVLILCGFWMVTIAASIGGLINFAHLRIHALKNAMKNQKYSKKRAIICVLLSWLLPLAGLFVPPIAGWNCIDYSGGNMGKDCSQVVFPFTKPYVLMLVSLLFFSIIWLSVLYVWIFMLVHKRLEAVKGMTAQTSTNKDTERQLFNTMMIILSIFFLCHCPVGVVLIFDYIIVEQNTALVDAFQIILTISFINALLNPILYYWRMPATRDAFWLALGKREKTQNKLMYSRSSVNSKRNDRFHFQNTLSIVDLESNKIDNNMKCTSI